MIKEWEHFELLNRLRAEGFTCPNGQTYSPNLEPLQFDCRLWRASQLHSQDMADNGYFDHYSQDGRSPWDRAEAQGISANAENLAAGRALPQDTLEQWKNSDGHCRNMMNPNSKLFAVGYAFNDDSRYRHYWTQLLKTMEVPLETSCYPEFDEQGSVQYQTVDADLDAVVADIGESLSNSEASN